MFFSSGISTKTEACLSRSHRVGLGLCVNGLGLGFIFCKYKAQPRIFKTGLCVWGEIFLVLSSSAKNENKGDNSSLVSAKKKKGAIFCYFFLLFSFFFRLKKAHLVKFEPFKTTFSFCYRFLVNFTFNFKNIQIDHYVEHVNFSLYFYQFILYMNNLMLKKKFIL